MTAASTSVDAGADAAAVDERVDDTAPAAEGAGRFELLRNAIRIRRTVIGLVLLAAWLRWRGGVPASLDGVATAFAQNLGLLFIPAAVGVVMFWPQLRSHALAIAIALVASVVATMAVTALVLRALSKDDPG